MRRKVITLIFSKGSVSVIAHIKDGILIIGNTEVNYVQNPMEGEPALCIFSQKT